MTLLWALLGEEAANLDNLYGTRDRFPRQRAAITAVSSLIQLANR